VASTAILDIDGTLVDAKPNAGGPLRVRELVSGVGGSSR
jgi:hypothetical protein